MQSPESSIDWHDHGLVLIWMCGWVRLNLVHMAPLAEPRSDLAERERERDTEMQSQAACLMEFIKMEVSCCTL